MDIKIWNTINALLTVLNFVILYFSLWTEHNVKLILSDINNIQLGLPLFNSMFTLSRKNFVRDRRHMISLAFTLIFRAFYTCKLQKSAMSNHLFLLHVSGCFLFGQSDKHLSTWVCLPLVYHHVPFFSQVTSISHSHFLPISNKV